MSAQYQPHNHIKIVKADVVDQFHFRWSRNDSQESSLEDELHAMANVQDKAQKFDHVHQHHRQGSFTKEVQFKSLKDILHNFSRRRSITNGDVDLAELKKQISLEDRETKLLHTKVQDLEKQLTLLYREDENKRTDEKNHKIRNLEAELIGLRAKLQFHEKFDDSHIPYTTVRRSSTKSTPDLESDKGSEEDELEFIEPADLDLTRDQLIPNATHLSITSIDPIHASAFYVPDPCQEKQIQQFENVIAELSEQLAHTRSALGVLKIELSNLGFNGASVDSCKEVLTTIRQAFRQARLEFRELFPNQDIETIQNGTFLTLLTSNVRGILARMEEQVLRIQRQEEAIVLYRAQYNGVLSKLAESEGQRVHLEEVERSSKVKISKQEREISIIEKQLNQFIFNFDNPSKKQSLTSVDLGRFTEVFTQFQQRYELKLQQLNKEKTDAVSTWKTKYENERVEKDRLQQEVSQKQKSLLSVQKTVTSLKDDVRTIQAKYDSEHQSNVSINKNLQSKIQHIHSIEEKLRIEVNTNVEVNRKLEIAREALTAQKKRDQTEIEVEIEKRRKYESQLTEVTNLYHRLQKSSKHEEEKSASLKIELHSIKEHSKALEQRITILNTSLTEKVTQLRALETKITHSEELHTKLERQVHETKQRLKLITDAKLALETKITESSSTSKHNIEQLEFRTAELTTRIKDQTLRLSQLETEYTNEKQISSSLRLEIEKVQRNAKITAKLFEDARSQMQQVQSEVIKRVMQEIAGQQKLVKARFEEVESQYDGVLNGLQAIKLDGGVEREMSTGVVTKKKLVKREVSKGSSVVARTERLSSSKMEGSLENSQTIGGQKD